MNKNRKGNKRDKGLGLRLSLCIAPWAAIVVGVVYWILSSFSDNLKWFINKEDINKILNNDKQIEQQDESYISEEEKNEEIELNQDTLEDNTQSNLEENKETNQEVKAIPYPDIIPEVDFERTSSEIYDSWGYFPEFDWESANETNEDVNALLYIPGLDPQDPDKSIINLPIVQGNDNDYYLHYDIENNPDKNGTLFIDWRDNPLDCEMQELSDITTIYGHQRSNGMMFTPLRNYKSQKYYDKFPYGIIIAENGEVYKLDFFAGVIVDGNSEYNVYATDFIDEEQFYAYFDNIISNSTFESDCDIQYGDKIIALSTCSYEYSNARFVLYGRLTRQLINDQAIQSTLGSK